MTQWLGDRKIRRLRETTGLDIRSAKSAIDHRGRFVRMYLSNGSAWQLRRDGRIVFDDWVYQPQNVKDALSPTPDGLPVPDCKKQPIMVHHG